MTKEDPLKDLYEDKSAINRERLADALQGVIGIDEETGDPIYHTGYQELSNKKKFVAQLLYRSATVALEDREVSEQGGQSGDFAEHLGASASAVQNYASELDFIVNEEDKGGYVIPGYAIDQAINFIQEE